MVESPNDQKDGDRKRAEFPWPEAAAGAVSEFRTMDFYRVAPQWLIPGGVCCFFGDRPYGEGLKFPDFAETLVYNGDRFSAEFAPPFVAMNMMYRRRSGE